MFSSVIQQKLGNPEDKAKLELHYGHLEMHPSGNNLIGRFMWLVCPTKTPSQLVMHSYNTAFVIYFYHNILVTYNTKTITCSLTCSQNNSSLINRTVFLLCVQMSTTLTNGTNVWLHIHIC